MSAVLTRRMKTSRPSGFLRSSVSERLLRCRFWKSALSRGEPKSSGTVDSILMTSAPKSANCLTQVGPERTRVRSRIRRCERAGDAVIAGINTYDTREGSEMERGWDVIVIGAGAAGLTSAKET